MALRLRTNVALIHSPLNTMQNGWFCAPPFELARRWLARWGRLVKGPLGAMDGGRRAPMDGSSVSRTSLPHAGLPGRGWAVNGSPPPMAIWARAGTGQSRQAGFTLIELVVALSIAILALGSTIFALQRLVETAEYHAAVRDVLTEMRSARQTAMRQGTETVFQFDPQTRRFGREPELRHSLPERLSVDFVGARHEIQPDGIAQIRFFPDGSSTGGSMTLTRLSGTGVQLRVSWLLGRVNQYSVINNQ